MRNRPLSNSDWARDYRERYRNDPDFRESEKRRVRNRYQKKPKVDVFEIDGKRYINSRTFMQITGLNRSLFYRLKKDKVIKPAKQIKKNKRYLFVESDAYLFKDFLHTFIINPSFSTIEKYDIKKLRDFLDKNREKYDFKNKCFIDI